MKYMIQVKYRLNTGYNNIFIEDICGINTGLYNIKSASIGFLLHVPLVFVDLMFAVSALVPIENSSPMQSS